MTRVQIVEPDPGNGGVRQESVTLSVRSGIGFAVLRAISEAQSSKILESIIPKGMTIEEIGIATGVPVSTVYRKMHEMTDDGLAVVERAVISRDGKRSAIYRATFSRVKVEFEPEDCRVEGTPNAGIPDIMYRLWQFSIKHGGQAVSPG